MTDTHGKAWENLARRMCDETLYTPPGRPSEEALAAYREFLKKVKGKNPHALVLGATPALRDLLSSLKYNVVAIDRSKEMINAMQKIIANPNPREKVIKANWLHLPFPNHFFDVALGDIVLQNVPASQQDAFLREIHRVLTPSGFFIAKMQLLPDDWVFEDIITVLKKYEKAPWARNLPMEMCCCLSTNTNRRGKASLKTVHKWMKKYRKGRHFCYPHKVVEKSLNRIWEFWKPMGKEWSFGYAYRVENQLRPYFRVLQKAVLHDCFRRCVDKVFPIWLCKKVIAARRSGSTS